MYSSRRKSNYRSRSYRYRKRVNNIYAPGMRNFDLPSYHQMKGRTIQSSPRNLCNPPTYMPPPDEYDQMYKKLVAVGYGPVVNPPQPVPPSPPEPFLPEYPFILTITNDINSFFPIEGEGSNRFINTDLQDAVSSFDLPDLPSGYHYEAFLIGLNFDFDTGQDSSGWDLKWYSNIFSNPDPVIFVSKTQNLTLSAPDYNHEAFAVANQSSMILYRYLTFTTTDVSSLSSSKAVTISLDLSQDRVPLISTAEDDTNYLELTSHSSQFSPKAQLSMFVQLKINSDT